MKKWLTRILLTITIAVLGLVGSLQVAPDQMTAFAIDLERSAAGLEKKQLTLPSGETIVYLENDTAQNAQDKKETLVLLHGFGSNKDIFVRAAAKLTDDFHVLIPDQAGFGESTRKLGQDYTSDKQAVRLQQFLASKNISKAHIGGNSMGGHIALAYAAMFPELTKSLWLINPGGFWSVPLPPAMKSFGREDHALLVKSADDFKHLYELTMYNPPYVPEAMLEVMAKPSIADRPLHVEISKQLVKDSIESRAATVKVPTLLTWGEEDQLINLKTTETILKLMPQTKLILMKDTGHMPMAENPKQVVNDYVAFLKSLNS